MNPAEMQKRLEEFSRDRGVAYGRVHELFDSERKYGLDVAARFHGYLALSDAFKSFFLETTEVFNSAVRPPTPNTTGTHPDQPSERCHPTAPLPTDRTCARTFVGCHFSAYQNHCMESHGRQKYIAPVASASPGPFLQ